MLPGRQIILSGQLICYVIHVHLIGMLPTIQSYIMHTSKLMLLYTSRRATIQNGAYASPSRGLKLHTHTHSFTTELVFQRLLVASQEVPVEVDKFLAAGQLWEGLGDHLVYRVRKLITMCLHLGGWKGGAKGGGGRVGWGGGGEGCIQVNLTVTLSVKSKGQLHSLLRALVHTQRLHSPSCTYTPAILSPRCIIHYTTS